MLLSRRSLWVLGVITSLTTLLSRRRCYPPALAAFSHCELHVTLPQVSHPAHLPSQPLISKIAMQVHEGDSAPLRRSARHRRPNINRREVLTLTEAQAERTHLHGGEMLH